MATFSKKMMGKEVGDASVYAQPHDMSGKKMTDLGVEYMTDPNSMSAAESTPGGMPARRVSGGNPANTNVKTTGIKMRGAGAATKGVMCRGPMA
jgi:hypothetical protein